MGKFSFEDAGRTHYVYWQEQDRKTLRRINQLLQSIERDGICYRRVVKRNS